MLTEIQKKLVNQILDGKIYDFSTFLFENKLTEEDNKEKIDNILYKYKTGFPIDKDGQQIFIMLKNVKESFDIIINFISLLKILEEKNFIFTNKIIYSSYIKFDINYYNVEEKILIKNMNSLFNEREIIEFYPTEELKELKKREYLTENEYFTKEEDKDRKAALKQAIISQRWTIGISLGIFIIGTIINLFIYTKDRDVSIKNNKDTTKVLLVNPQEKIPDTLQLKK